MVDPREAYRQFKEEKADEAKWVKEPPLIATIRADVKKDYICPYCKASRRADVHYRPDLSSLRETCVEIECRAFLQNKEVCGNVETRYY